MTKCSNRSDYRTRKHWSMFITEACSDCGGLIWIFPSDPPMFLREQRIHASRETLEQVRSGDVHQLQIEIEQVWNICGFYAKPRKFILFLEEFQPELLLWKALFEQSDNLKLLQGVEERLVEESSQYSLESVEEKISVSGPIQHWSEGMKIGLQKTSGGLLIGISEWNDYKESGLFYWRYPNQVQRIREGSKCTKITSMFWREETKKLVNLLHVSVDENEEPQIKELLNILNPKRGYISFHTRQIGSNYLFHYATQEPPYHVHYQLYDEKGECLAKWISLETYACYIGESGVCFLNELELPHIYTVTLRDKKDGRILARSEKLPHKEKETRDECIYQGLDALCYTSPRRGKGRLWHQEGKKLIGVHTDPPPYPNQIPATPTYPDSRLQMGGNSIIDLLISYDHICPWFCTVLNRKTEQRAKSIEREQKPSTFSICFGEDGVWIVIDLQAAYIRPEDQEIQWLDLPRSMKCVSVSSKNRLLLVSNDDAKYHILLEEYRIIGEIENAQVELIEDVFFALRTTRWSIF